VSYQVYLKRSAERELNRLHEPIFGHIKRKLLSLEDNPRPAGVQKLHGQEAYRIRASDYRILYTIDDAARRIEIIAVGHRRDIYR